MGIKRKNKWGGRREGQGRPKGSKNKTTIEKKKAEIELQNRIIKNVDQLINAQFDLAKGCQFLFKTIKLKKGTKTVIVDNPLEVKAYFDGEYEGSDEYYFITTQKPDNFAIQALLDRAFGKAKHRTELSGEDGEPIQVTGINYITPDGSTNKSKANA